MPDIIAVIQAGGKGTRMASLTKNVIPKPMLKINGRPMIECQMECLKRYGIFNFVFIVGHLGGAIREYFKDGACFGVHIDYIEESEPLGSAGSFFYLKDYPAKRYILVYGDVMFDMDIDRWMDSHLRKSAVITTVCHPNSHPYDSDLLVLDSNSKVLSISGKKEKRTGWQGNLVNAGLFIFEADILESFTELLKRDFEKDILSRYIAAGGVYGYRTCEYIKDAGTPERFESVALAQTQGLWQRKNLSNKQRSIFLDRDGTVNKYVGLVSDPAQIVLEEKAADAIRLINQSGYLAIIVTNQPVVARGMCSMADVEEINKKIETLLGVEGAYVDDIIFCPHHPDRGYPEENPAYKIPCQCRKPKTGMFDSMAEKYNIDLQQSFMVGDTTVDVMAGINAGTKTVLLRTGEAGADMKYDVKPDCEAADLLEAVEWILAQ